MVARVLLLETQGDFIQSNIFAYMYKNINSLLLLRHVTDNVRVP